MTIRSNTFINCGITIDPKTRSNDPAEPVHENIRIENNFFQGAGISAKSTSGLTITGNTSPEGKFPIRTDASCSGVKVENNSARASAPRTVSSRGK